MKQSDLKLLSIARSLAQTSTHAKAQIGALIVAEKSIVGVGINGEKSHPLQAEYNMVRFKDDACQHLMHAEIAAIVKGRYLLNRSPSATIYIYRTMKEGGSGMCRPCVGCMRALKDFRITRMFYSTDDGLAYEELA